MAELQVDPEQPWNQIAGVENNRWYSRFLIFRDMGPVRSILGVARIECQRLGKPKAKWTPGSWRGAAEKFEWHKRAEALDRYQREEVFTEGYASDLFVISAGETSGNR